MNKLIMSAILVVLFQSNALAFVSAGQVTAPEAPSLLLMGLGLIGMVICIRKT